MNRFRFSRDPVRHRSLSIEVSRAVVAGCEALVNEDSLTARQSVVADALRVDGSAAYGGARMPALPPSTSSHGSGMGRRWVARSLMFKLVVIIAIAGSATGALAATGALPTPIQERLVRVIRLVGIVKPGHPESKSHGAQGKVQRADTAPVPPAAEPGAARLSHGTPDDRTLGDGSRQLHGSPAGVGGDERSGRQFDDHDSGRTGSPSATSGHHPSSDDTSSGDDASSGSPTSGSNTSGNVDAGGGDDGGSAGASTSTELGDTSAQDSSDGSDSPVDEHDPELKGDHENG